MRERLEAHRANPSCNGCHGVIDPLGFALENYDVVGALARQGPRRRQRHRRAAARSRAARRSAAPRELSKALLARPDQFVQALTEKLMMFALGRALRYQDMPAVRAIVRQAAARGLSLRVARPRHRRRATRSG